MIDELDVDDPFGDSNEKAGEPENAEFKSRLAEFYKDFGINLT